MAEEIEAAQTEAHWQRGLSGFPDSRHGSSDSPLSLDEALKRPQTADEERLATGFSELDRLLGGGALPGQVILLAGPPGIGKSTLVLQAAASLGSKRRFLYVSGEESREQVLGRARRLGLSSDRLFLLSETNLASIMTHAEKAAAEGLVVDSIQTIFHPELPASPGSVVQVRECAFALLARAKAAGMPLFLLGHVTKDGALAGPKLLEHMVDTVLYFDSERQGALRILRATKNRFGPTDEIGLFEMSAEGLRDVPEASSFFRFGASDEPVAGRASSISIEGTRPLVVQVESLAVYTRYPLPRRMATGIDLNRVMVLLAASEKHLRLKLENQDVFVSLAGGLKLKDPAIDLAVCLSVASALSDAPIGPEWALVGEVGLLGQLRSVSHLETRLKEAVRAGFRKALVPSRSVKGLPGKTAAGLELVEARDLASAAKAVLRGS